jgi:CheY-like chemotaxis protein
VHVLVAEDNTVNQKVIVRRLQKRGCTVDVAANGIEAVAAIKQTPYRLVLMDCQMPEMDGYAAVLQIRKMASPHRLPIIALTANAMEGDEAKCLSAGMDDYLSKPLHPAKLDAVLERWCRPVPAVPEPAPVTLPAPKRRTTKVIAAKAGAGSAVLDPV